jgi:hypothetical protein
MGRRAVRALLQDMDVWGPRPLGSLQQSGSCLQVQYAAPYMHSLYTVKKGSIVVRNLTSSPVNKTPWLETECFVTNKQRRPIIH